MGWINNNASPHTTGSLDKWMGSRLVAGLALGSVWTIIPVIVALIIAVIRTELEDKTLQEELPGYRDYVRRVRYRLIPGVF